MHRLALETDEDRDGIAALFDADPLGHRLRKQATETILHVGDNAPRSGRCARWIIPVPCSASIASFESSSRLWRMIRIALRSS